jgi:hypothetical protein
MSECVYVYVCAMRVCAKRVCAMRVCVCVCDLHAARHPVHILQTEAHIATAQQQF